MEDQMISIPLHKVIEMIRAEERQAIKDDLTAKFGKTTGDCVDTYTPGKSKLMEVFFTK